GPGVTPVFAPPRETGFQAAIEYYNGRWKAKVWARFTHASPGGLRERSDRYDTASRERAAARIEAAPPPRPVPGGGHWELPAPLRGRILSLRRAGATGAVERLGHRFEVDPTWPIRLVRAEVDLDAGVRRFYALRRRETARQPVLREVVHRLSRRRFRE